MVKSVIGLVGGATLALVGGVVPVEAATAPGQETELKPARSYAELLDPVPNASATLKALETKARAREPASLEMAQYYNYGYGGYGNGYGYHHHHHHHHWGRWRHHHHWWGRGHHHHHQYW